MIYHFPDVFKPAFVFSGQVSPADVLKILHPRPDESEMNEHTKRIWKYVVLFVESWLVFKYHCYDVYFYRVKGFSPIYYWSTCTIWKTFDDHDGEEAISVNTCGRQLILSTCIVDEEAALKALIMERTFTMP